MLLHAAFTSQASLRSRAAGTLGLRRLRIGGSASDALFGFILPTPTAGLHADYFWRVARRLDADGHIAEAAPARTLQHRSFSTRVDAAVFGTQIGERLVSVTECSGSGGVETTVWYWEG